MKAKYSGYEAKRSGGFVTLPPEGAYVGEIKGVRVEKSYDKIHDAIVLSLDITEGEYKNRYKEQFLDASERFGKATSRGVLYITVPEEDDPQDKAWIKSTFESNLWAVEDSNENYHWDWDEKKLVGKKVGFSVRKRFYTGEDKEGHPVDRETTEICRLESVSEVKAGKVRPVKARDTRTKKAEENGTYSYADVTNSVEVPF
jgi:hypothetical protein